MDSISPPLMQNMADDVASGGKLRRRRGQECSNQVPNSHVGELQMQNEEQQQNEDVELNDAEAREIASRLIARFQAGGKEQEEAVASFERLAFTSKATSRAAQIALEDASMSEAAAIATGLRGHIRNASQSKHANYVVQKITEVL